MDRGVLIMEKYNHGICDILRLDMYCLGMLILQGGADD